MRSTIRQFDVVPNPIRVARDDKPYLLCVQHYLLDHLSSRLMASLVSERIVSGPSRLHPAIRLEGAVLYFDPTDFLSLPMKAMRAPIANLAGERDRIVAALDLVFTGI